MLLPGELGLELTALQMAVVLLAFFCGGLIKGAAGFGLPLIAVSITASVIPVEVGLALVILPILTTNFYQGVAGGTLRPIVKRFWPVMLSLAIGMPIGAYFVKSADPKSALFLLALVVLLYCLSRLLGFHLTIPPRHEKAGGMAFGLISGLIGGITAVYGPPLAIYFSALRLERELFISAAGVIWFACSLILTASYVSLGILTAERGLLSLFCVAPAFLGLWAGTKLRRKIHDELFHRIVVWLLFIVALNLLRKALF